MHHPTEKYISAITDALIRIAEHPEKRKKNSFDQLYLDAENGDRESRRKLADAYRNGIGVRANAKLADWWEQWK